MRRKSKLENWRTPQLNDLRTYPCFISFPCPPCSPNLLYVLQSEIHNYIALAVCVIVKMAGLRSRHLVIMMMMMMLMMMMMVHAHRPSWWWRRAKVWLDSNIRRSVARCQSSPFKSWHQEDPFERIYIYQAQTQLTRVEHSGPHPCQTKTKTKTVQRQRPQSNRVDCTHIRHDPVTKTKTKTVEHSGPHPYQTRLRDVLGPDPGAPISNLQKKIRKWTGNQKITKFSSLPTFSKNFKPWGNFSCSTGSFEGLSLVHSGRQSFKELVIMTETWKWCWWWCDQGLSMLCGVLSLQVEKVSVPKWFTYNMTRGGG